MVTVKDGVAPEAKGSLVEAAGHVVLVAASTNALERSGAEVGNERRNETAITEALGSLGGNCPSIIGGGVDVEARRRISISKGLVCRGGRVARFLAGGDGRVTECSQSTARLAGLDLVDYVSAPRTERVEIVDRRSNEAEVVRCIAITESWHQGIADVDAAASVGGRDSRLRCVEPRRGSQAIEFAADLAAHDVAYRVPGRRGIRLDQKV